MSIDANVAYVELKEDGSGVLHLYDRVASHGQIDGICGQNRLHFETAPYEVTALNGLAIWGGSDFLMLGEKKIATRQGYTRISFIEREPFLAAIAEYHERQRRQTFGIPSWTNEGR